MLTLFIAFVTLLFVQRSITPPVFDTLLYGNLSKLFVTNLSTPLSLPQLNMLVTNPTTGPLFIPFFSLIQGMLGYSLENISLSAFILNSLLLSILFLRLLQLYPTTWLGFAIASAVCATFYVQDTRWFLYALGDGPALILTLIAVTYALDQRYSLTKRHCYFTIWASFALMTRLTVLPLIAGAAIFLVLLSWLQLPSKKQIARLIKLCLQNVVIFTVLYALILLIEYALLKPANISIYLELLGIRQEFFSNNQTTHLLRGDDLMASFTLIAQSASKNYLMMREHFQSRLGFDLATLASAMLLTVLACICSIKKLQQHRLVSFFYICCFMLLLQSIWFFSTAELLYSRYTHQLISVLLIACAAGLLIISPYLLSSAAALICLALFVTKATAIAEIPGNKGFRDLQQKTLQQSAAITNLTDFLQQQPLPSFSFLKIHGISFIMPINYLLPMNKQITGAEEIINQQINLHGQINSDLLLVMDRFMWRVMKFKSQNLSFQNRLHRSCNEEVFGNEAYRVMLCKAELLNQEFPADEVNSWQLPAYVW